MLFAKKCLFRKFISAEDELYPPISLISAFMLVVSTAALWIGADSSSMGRKLSPTRRSARRTNRFYLLAIGTSLPELAASISLVQKKQTSMLLGNIVGSNLFNIALIGGLAGILGPVRSGSPHPWIDYLFLILTTLMLFNWLKGKTLTKIEG